MKTDAERIHYLFGRQDWKPNEKNQRIAELAEQGLTGGEIAREVCQTRNAVMGVCHRLGIKLKGRPFAYGKWKRTKRAT